jgi:hypothetical protein
MARTSGVALGVALLVFATAAPPAAAGPDGQVSWAVNVALAPAWFEGGRR